MCSGDSPSDLRVWMGATQVQQPTQQPVAAFRGGESLGKQAVHMQILRNTSTLKTSRSRESNYEK